MIIPSQYSPSFDPPFESPLEEKFSWAIIKYLDPSVRFKKQITVLTFVGTFRIDFVTCQQDVRIGFECDGEDFHDPFRDECRDALILGGNQVDAIYRIKGKDIEHHVEDCLYLMSRWDPQLFSSRGRHNLAILSSKEAKLAWPPWTDTMFFSFRNSPFSVVMERRSRHVPSGERRHWQFLYSYARSNGVRTLDELVSRRKAEFSKRPSSHSACDA